MVANVLDVLGGDVATTVLGGSNMDCVVSFIVVVVGPRTAVRKGVMQIMKITAGMNSSVQEMRN